jgi:hypothetical protein
MVVAEAANDAVDWALLVGEVGRAFELEPDVEVLPSGTGRKRAVDRMFAEAAAVPGPVLILPSRPARRGHGSAAPGALRPPDRQPSAMGRVLIPSDASDEVAAATAALYARLSGIGVQSTVLHVLTEDNLPRMWEGSGYHAAEWLDELRRRHGAAAGALSVVTGEPQEELRAYAAGADLVVMLWRHDTSAGRAMVLRSVLRNGIMVPHLLVPLHWVAGARPPDTNEGTRRCTDA